ncbi:hypothetical protein AK812_SmicGene10555 [Symbiodinium microadriaticum]|uniref:Uncharacterized protein n=1 Tax=Symbiodinium microadriaticum TaxID=2951 RepID=A0A1Q9EFK7_SYMMI|nr:hypothetical protein AK812_SmicGene10555 [Symbiodinium microadriaticum]
MDAVTHEDEKYISLRRQSRGVPHCSAGCCGKTEQVGVGLLLLRFPEPSAWREGFIKVPKDITAPANLNSFLAERVFTEHPVDTERSFGCDRPTCDLPQSRQRTRRQLIRSMEGLASGVSVALDFVSLSALVMVRCYIAQCCRALTASEAKREFKAVGYWVERFVMVLIAFQVYALCIDAWLESFADAVFLKWPMQAAHSSEPDGGPSSDKVPDPTWAVLLYEPQELDKWIGSRFRHDSRTRELINLETGKTLNEGEGDECRRCVQYSGTTNAATLVCYCPWWGKATATWSLNYVFSWPSTHGK